jgi:hypothetical protein
MPTQSCLALPGGCVKDPQDLVTSSGQLLAIGAVAHAGNGALVALRSWHMNEPRRNQ